MAPVVLIPQTDHPEYRLGRHQEHDPASLEHPFTAPGPVEYVTTLWPDRAPILNQGNIGGCVGWTGADILNTDAFAAVRAKFNGGKFYGNAEGLKLYGLSTTLDGIDAPNYPPNDRGSSGLGLAKALLQLGLIGSYSHAFGFRHFQDAISFGPVACGTLWTRDMFQPDADGLVHIGALTDDNVSGGHEYMVRGINYETKRVRGRNHWKRSWGDDGEFEVGFDEFDELLCAGGDVTVLHGAVS